MKRIGIGILTLLLSAEISVTGTELTGASHSELRTLRTKQLLKRIGSRFNATVNEGYSFVVFIPFVTRAQNTRTNLGLNNISQDSVAKGAKPAATVHIYYIDSGGFPAGEGEYVVQSNELRQINDVVTALKGDVDTGWLFILSDEPIEVWASVIFNDTNDPGIEIGSSDAFERLLIPSSVKSNLFQSSLILVNLGFGGGEVLIKILDQTGAQINSKTVFIDELGIYVDPDIRSSVPGTFGEIIVEAKDPSVLLMGSSLVKSANGTGGFFPAVPLPPENLTSIAGVWSGNLTGTVNSAEVELTLFQQGTTFGGTLDILSGKFATGATTLSVGGFVQQDGATQKYILRASNSFDEGGGFYTFQLYAPQLVGPKLEGKTLYLDEKGTKETGTFTLTRTGHVYSP